MEDCVHSKGEIKQCGGWRGSVKRWDKMEGGEAVRGMGLECAKRGVKEERRKDQGRGGACSKKRCTGKWSEGARVAAVGEADQM